MKNSAEQLLTASLVVAALTASSAFAYRAFTAQGGTGPDKDNGTSTFAEWQEAVTLGRWLGGDSSAAVTMVVFSDFECPACKAFHQRIVSTALERYPDELQVRYLHYPLEYHKQAMPAAIATECLSNDIELSSWFNVLFGKQDSLGIKSYRDFALAVRVADIGQFEGCLTKSDTSKRITAGLALGQRLAIAGTPAVGVNGKLFNRPPSLEDLDSLVASTRKHPKW